MLSSSASHKLRTGLRRQADRGSFLWTKHGQQMTSVLSMKLNGWDLLSDITKDFDPQVCCVFRLRLQDMLVSYEGLVELG